MNEVEVLFILNQLEPKFKSVLYQTSPDFREDLEQDLKERVINIIQNNKMRDVPSFFDFYNDVLM
ncbi:putative house-cleaning noncanonical NTP pyrophosphatase (MazG superfamily) [Sporosarcina luteola]|nr:putative house-cleaning noncanonical NTP pyrophosphatase (MazG superfamily) [Sporosarcina luteola]